MHQSARLVGSVVMCCSSLTSHVLGVYFSMVEVQETSCHILGSSCWVTCDISETNLLTQLLQHLTEPSSPVHPLLSRIFSAVFKVAKSMCSPTNIAIDTMALLRLERTMNLIQGRGGRDGGRGGSEGVRKEWREEGREGERSEAGREGRGGV